MSFAQFFARFPQGTFLPHEGHLIPLELTAPSQLTDRSKVFFPYPRSAIELKGEDRTGFLNGLGPTDLRTFKAGQGTRCLLTNAHGHVIFDTHLYGFEDRLVLFPEPGEEKKLLAHLEFNAIMEQVTFADLGEAFELAVVFGLPEASQCLGAYSLEVGAGFEVVFGGEGMLAQLADLGLSPIGFELYEQLRPIYKIARSGVDFGAHQLPQEAGLEPFMAFQKGCYLGQEPISRVAFRGKVRNRLEQVICAQPLEPGEKLFAQGQEVGSVTSTSLIQTGQGHYHLAYLSTKATEEPNLELTAQGKAVTLARRS
ncbi:MAG: hypothetical protein A2600_03575 [Candidatus Lambdaproteobacteria bacterium RIFOXYD1_FULL_56_27]|uniref:Uncharacterized protein n=1 Tax=Candidatus Lambdaproteobacteria bacterium RIFOXYD2_FULL_56_26 TaxID=1817773 RepID=A0A1F6H376_9PROT|nr:MAG: hypothetical protein A2426_11635 [Candidatus Lambdaproteobacteria bacterium RIFOXYC1_FULL_56_13]OGH04847.1 MAG: hypothetical protein A2557_07640 [Candidatus Lambdaproteobacteria bacterium RIFOXYD2_FULL_56_26]OGH09312.1 MAG: hypothetical protein A2600_03575 [Candidatus Lambdaproteobacteria bacterium RIFOXYD1_FULL_56_27]